MKMLKTTTKKITKKIILMTAVLSVTFISAVCAETNQNKRSYNRIMQGLTGSWYLENNDNSLDSISLGINVNGEIKIYDICNQFSAISVIENTKSRKVNKKKKRLRKLSFNFGLKNIVNDDNSNTEITTCQALSQFVSTLGYESVIAKARLLKRQGGTLIFKISGKRYKFKKADFSIY